MPATDNKPSSPFEIITPAKKGGIGKTGIIVAVVVVLLLGLGVYFGVSLVQQNQNVAEKAAGNQTATSRTCPEAEACPYARQPSLLRNCTPAEADNTPDEQLCNRVGAIGSCGGKQFCCPGVGQSWTTDMSKCSAAQTTTPPSMSTMTCGDNFSDNFDGSIDSSKWTVNNSASISSGNLVVTIPAGTPTGQISALMANKMIKGDFTITYDMPEISKSGSGFGTGYLSLWNSDQTKIITVGRKIDKDGVYTIGANFANGQNNGNSVSSNASDKVTFKVERKAGQVVTYYKTSGDYQQLYSLASSVTDDLVIRLTGLNGGNPAPVTTIKYDNFSIGCPSGSNTGTNTNTPTPTATATTRGATTRPTTSPTRAPIPVTGTNWPTVAGAGFGILVVVGSILLAI